MLSKCFFSIIVPVYKVEQYLAECIESVLFQTFANYEIILVNDGSPDNSPRICDTYSEKFDNIRVIHKKNEGLSAARNSGIREAQGEYVIFLDSDDKFEDKDVLKNIHDYINLVLQDVIFCSSIKRFSDMNELIYNPFTNIKNTILDMNLFFDFVKKKSVIFSATALIIKRIFLLENDLFFYNGILHEDMEWCPRVFVLLDKVAIFSGNFYMYRINQCSITANINPKRFIDIEFIIDRINELLVKFNTKKEFLLKWTNMLIYNYFVLLIRCKNNDNILYSEKYPHLKSLLRKNSKILNFRNRFIFFLIKLGFFPLFISFRSLIKKK